MCSPSEDGEAIIVNPSDRLAMTSLCKEECEPELTYKWSISLPDGTPIPESLLHFPVGRYIYNLKKTISLC